MRKGKQIALAKAKGRKEAVRPTTSITSLYREFALVFGAVKAMHSTDPRYNPGVSKCSDMAARLVTMPAVNIDEMLIKIKVARWCENTLPLDKLDDWKPSATGEGEEWDALASLRDDLRRLKGTP